MRVYISGPIKGDHAQTMEQKLESFYQAALVLKDNGIDSVNPLEIKGCDSELCNIDVSDRGHSWSCYLKHDIITMLSVCDHILFLPGWEQSPGSQLERLVASSCGLSELSWGDFEEMRYSMNHKREANRRKVAWPWVQT